MKPTAFDKRVKRRVTAQEHSFFAVCPPGLTRFCHGEILGFGLEPEKTAIAKGGVTFSCRIDTCTSLNLHLGSPSRILMRIAGFKAATFHQFEKKMADIDWELYLPRNCSPELKVQTKKSALYHTDAIAQRSSKIIYRHLGLDDDMSEPDIPQTDTSARQLIFIRAEQDRFEISIDTSGDLLFKRGVKKMVTPAPLRETLAFAMLRWAGFSAGDTLFDPMCGSGTFSLEGAMICQGIPPGYFRSFAFESQPGFSQKTLEWQKNQAKNRFSPLSDQAIFSSDTDQTAVDALLQNSDNPHIKGIIQCEKADFFDINHSQKTTARQGVVMLNPPYGKRLGKKTKISTFYRDIGKKLKSDFSGFRVGIILPDRKTYQHLGLSLQLHPIFHGGLDVFAGIGKI